MAHRPVAPLLALLIVLPLAALADQPAPPELFEHLPRDPLFVWVDMNARPAEMWDGLIDLAERFLPEEELQEMRMSIAKVDETVGLSVRNDLLARIGPEVAVIVDLPDVDETVQQVMMGQASASGIFGKVGLVMGTPQGEKLEESLVHLALWLGGEPVAGEGLRQVRFVTPSGEGEAGAAKAASPGPAALVPFVDLFLDSRDGLLVAGFDQAFVERTLSGLAAESRLTAGEDFRRVFAQLDRRPESMTYFNVPKFVGRITGSQMAGGMLAASEETRPVLEMLNSPALTGMGAGSTSVTIDGGRRTTTYGPSFLTDTVQAGIVASIFIPNFLDALNKAKHKRTVTDMASVAEALEGFSRSNDAYPGPTEGWVPLSSYRAALEPAHVAELPTEDGWGHELLYSSDGTTYQLLSPGKDGVRGELPLAEGEESQADAYDGDVVLVDGEFSR